MLSQVKLLVIIFVIVLRKFRRIPAALEQRNKTPKMCTSKCMQQNRCTTITLYLILINIYMYLGAILFLYIETCREKAPEFADFYNNTSTNLSEIPTHKFPLVCSCGLLKITLQQQQHDYNNSITKDTTRKFLEICEENVNCQSVSLEQCHFSFHNIMAWGVFCWETISTIGYGSKVPKTQTGRLLLIPYSIFGIALVLAFLGKSGSLMKSVILKFICFIEIQVFNKEEVLHKECKVLIAAIILTSKSIILNAYLYSYVTGVEFLTSIYFSYITFSTIGFGDYNMELLIEKFNWWNILISAFLWSGMVGISTLVQALVDLLDKKQ